jgi:hypothetical protein
MKKVTLQLTNRDHTPGPSVGGYEFLATVEGRDFPLVVHRSWYGGSNFSDKLWQVTEPRTGGFICGDGATRKEVISIAKEIFAKKGRATIEHAIDRAFEAIGKAVESSEITAP